MNNQADNYVNQTVHYLITIALKTIHAGFYYRTSTYTVAALVDLAKTYASRSTAKVGQ